MEWFYLACSLYVIAAFVTDVRSMKIPNRLTLPVTVAGVLAHIIWGGWEGFCSPQPDSRWGLVSYF